MTTTSLTRRRFASTLGALACMPALAAGGAAALPGDSVYQLRATLTDHHGRAFELAARDLEPQQPRGAKALRRRFDLVHLLPGQRAASGYPDPTHPSTRGDHQFSAADAHRSTV